MGNPFDDPSLGKPKNPFDDPELGKPSGILRRGLGDPLVSLAKGIVSVPEAAVGLTDIPTLGLAGRAAEAAGVRFKDAQSALDEMYSPEQKAVNQKLADTKGFFPTIGAALASPSTILHQGIQSVPSMLGGAIVGRGALAAGEKLAPAFGEALARRELAASALGEGAVSAGQTAEQVRQETPGGLLTPAQSGISAASGALTGVLNRAGGAVAKKLGISDVDTALVTGKLAEKGTAGAAKRIGGGIISEGLLEELPQSAQEQVAQNLALGKPWNEGVAEAAAMGALVGGVMGGGANILHGKSVIQPTPETTNAADASANTADGSVAPGAVGPATVDTQGGAVLPPADAQGRLPDTAPPIIRDEAGNTAHPQDVAALDAAAQPDAGPLTQAAGASVLTGATESARVLAESTANEQNNSEQAKAQEVAQQESQKAAVAAQKAAGEAQQQAVAQDRSNRLDAILSDKTNAALTQSAETELGPLNADDHKAIKTELTTRALAQKEADQVAKASATASAPPSAELRPISRTSRPTPATANSQVDSSPASNADALNQDNAAKLPSDIPVDALERSTIPKKNDGLSGTQTTVPGSSNQGLGPFAQSTPKPATSVVKREQLFAEWGGQRHPVESVADAKEKWAAFRDKTGAQVTEVGNGVRVSNADGKFVARIAYTGKVLTKEGTTPAIRGQIQGEGGHSRKTPPDLAAHERTEWYAAYDKAVATGSDEYGVKPKVALENLNVPPQAEQLPSEGAKPAPVLQPASVASGPTTADTGVRASTQPDTGNGGSSAVASGSLSQFIPSINKVTSGGAADNVQASADRLRARVKEITGTKLTNTPGRDLTESDRKWFIGQHTFAPPEVKPLIKQVAEHAFPGIDLRTKAEKGADAKAKVIADKAAAKATRQAEKQAAKAAEPLMVKVKAIEAESGREATVDMPAHEAIKHYDESITRAERMLECLSS